jgi:hypothetical protein
VERPDDGDAAAVIGGDVLLDASDETGVAAAAEGGDWGDR